MKVYETSYDYDYSFPAVSLAYFLRYPNPYSRHVLSTDVIDRYVDPRTKRLHTTRLHLKRSKVPPAILKLLPKGLAGPGGASQSFIVEKSVLDIREGWMETESKNMEWTGILSVVERQLFRRQDVDPETWTQRLVASAERTASTDSRGTSCKTIVTFKSKLGQGGFFKKKLEAVTSSGKADVEPPKQGFFASWSASGIQRTVELVGMKRAKEALVKSKEGMNVVLERLRSGGVGGVLEGMRRDREAGLGPEAPWRRAWLHSAQVSESKDVKPNDSHDR